MLRMSVYRDRPEVTGRRSEGRNSPSLDIYYDSHRICYEGYKQSSPTSPQSASMDGSMRQKPVGSDQSHHGCENQQSRHGFSGGWPGGNPRGLGLTRPLKP